MVEKRLEMWTPGDRPVDWCCHGLPSLWCGSRRLTCCSTSPLPSPPPPTAHHCCFGAHGSLTGSSQRRLVFIVAATKLLLLLAAAAVTAPAASIRSPIKWESLQSFQYSMWINVKFMFSKKATPSICHCSKRQIDGKILSISVAFLENRYKHYSLKCYV